MHPAFIVIALIHLSPVCILTGSCFFPVWEYSDFLYLSLFRVYRVTAWLVTVPPGQLPPHLTTTDTCEDLLFRHSKGFQYHIYVF